MKTKKDLFTITEDCSNMDVPDNMNVEEAKQYYLNRHGGYIGKVGDPIIERYDDKFIFRADLSFGGLKAFGAEKIISGSNFDTFVYCAPRQGHAADAIASLAKMYNKKVVFFCPASKVVSDHQGALFAFDNVCVKFVRIAAMPVLNSYAKKWAEKNNAQFLPFGLSGSPDVTAGLVNVAEKITAQIGEPSEIHCAVSTGTMVRALQIGWPNVKAVGTAVARNIKKGERGNAELTSASIPFLRQDPVVENIPFPTTGAYDAKAWNRFQQGKPGAIFINVGSDAQINRNLSKVNIDSINSYREWGDLNDLETPATYTNGVQL